MFYKVRLLRSTERASRQLGIFTHVRTERKEPGGWRQYRPPVWGRSREPPATISSAKNCLACRWPRNIHLFSFWRAEHLRWIAVVPWCVADRFCSKAAARILAAIAINIYEPAKCSIMGGYMEDIGRWRCPNPECRKWIQYGIPNATPAAGGNVTSARGGSSLSRTRSFAPSVVQHLRDHWASGGNTNQLASTLSQ